MIASIYARKSTDDSDTVMKYMVAALLALVIGGCADSGDPGTRVRQRCESVAAQTAEVLGQPDAARTFVIQCMHGSIQRGGV